MREIIVNVGNIGNIGCSTLDEAKTTFNDYVKQSVAGTGRASGESVFLMIDGEIYQEFIGTNDKDSD